MFRRGEKGQWGGGFDQPARTEGSAVVGMEPLASLSDAAERKQKRSRG